MRVANPQVSICKFAVLPDHFAAPTDKKDTDDDRTKHNSSRPTVCLKYYITHICDEFKSTEQDRM